MLCLKTPTADTHGVAHRDLTQVGVLNWFARLWEIEQEEYWGYITNCGTEGNLHGILVGRENHPDGILYASRETHYSVFKAARMYRMDAEKVRAAAAVLCDVHERCSVQLGAWRRLMYMYCRDAAKVRAAASLCQASGVAWTGVHALHASRAQVARVYVLLCCCC